jgi:hypothetical protein
MKQNSIIYQFKGSHILMKNSNQSVNNKNNTLNTVSYKLNKKLKKEGEDDAISLSSSISIKTTSSNETGWNLKRIKSQSSDNIKSSSNDQQTDKMIKTKKNKKSLRDLYSIDDSLYKIILPLELGDPFKKRNSIYKQEILTNLY